MARRGAGFSLVEAAVAIGVVTILAGMMLPLGVKALDRQREIATRQLLQEAFEAMFGRRDRAVANMRSDFGYDPGVGAADLPELLARPPGVPAFGLHGALATFPWGYNGPYWHGPVTSAGGRRVPADAWGHPLFLVFTAGGPGGLGTWQLHSHGAAALAVGAPAPAGRAGDIFYPAVPAAVSSYQSTVVATLLRPVEWAADDPRCRVQIWLNHGNPGGGGDEVRPANTQPEEHLLTQPSTTLTLTAPAAGFVELIVRRLGMSTVYTIRVPMQFLPGEARAIQVNL